MRVSPGIRHHKPFQQTRFEAVELLISTRKKRSLPIRRNPMAYEIAFDPTWASRSFLSHLPVRFSHTLGRLWFSVDEPHGLSIPPICQIFPERRALVWFPSRQWVFRLCFTVGSGGAYRSQFSALFVPVENKPVPARAYKGEKWEPVCFPQAKLLYLLKQTGSRVILSFGNRFKNGNRFLEAVLRF